VSFHPFQLRTMTAVRGEFVSNGAACEISNECQIALSWNVSKSLKLFARSFGVSFSIISSNKAQKELLCISL